MSSDVEQIIKTFLKDFQVLESSVSGFLNLNDLDYFLDSLKACGFSFYKRNTVVYEASKRYKSSKIRFSYGTKIPFLGYPFMINKTIYMRCSQDSEYKPSVDKSKEDTPNRKKRTNSQPTKKIGCKAFLNITYILVFRSVRVKNIQTDKREASEKIKKNFAECAKETETRLLVELSSSKEHNHPPTTEDQIIHPLLKSEIYRLVANDVKSPSSVKSHLFEVVEKMIKDNKIPKPDENNHCFYPPNEVIRYHINMAKFSMKKETLDEFALSEFLDLWKSKCDDEFFFQSTQTLATGDIKTTPLWCHQTKWQQYLMNTYGNTITILDVAYKSTNYSFPLYFLIVKTNKSFIPVGTFVLNSTQEAAITQALNTFRLWNPNWNPKYFVCGHEDTERSAVHGVFPNSARSICSYRTYHTWRTWLNQNNTGEHSIHVLNLWEALMLSKTEDEFVQNETLMHNHPSYKTNAPVETYFYKIWYDLREQWVVAYQTQEFYVYMNLNNGAETGKDFFAYKFLAERNEKILSNILATIVTDYLPECFQQYYSYNISIRLNSHNLINRPIDFVNHFTERFENAENEFEAPTIISTDASKFMLKSSTEEDWYHVDFEEVNCTCDDFQKWRYPCIHMCSVFKHTSLTIDNLAQWYLNSPYLKSDSRFAEFSNNLPDWYRKRRTRVEHDVIFDEEENKKKRLIMDHIIQFPDPDTFAESEIDQTDIEVSEPNPEFSFSVCDPLQNKKSSIQNLLESLSHKVENMSENELNLCYERLKSLQDEITISELLM
ncbi:uncharacterized protein LOC135849149 [Planococcus citri]|uniref:uncharacterized protein LOC135849149 n=1 Tax=Planococcus citri TaxID=170843 RepID=UPI0031F81E3C